MQRLNLKIIKLFRRINNKDLINKILLEIGDIDNRRKEILADKTTTVEEKTEKILRETFLLVGISE
jgi:hypothetical protein